MCASQICLQILFYIIEFFFKLIYGLKHICVCIENAFVYQVIYIYNSPNTFVSPFSCIYSFMCALIHCETVLAPQDNNPGGMRNLLWIILSIVGMDETDSDGGWAAQWAVVCEVASWTSWARQCSLDWVTVSVDIRLGHTAEFLFVWLS